MRSFAFDRTVSSRLVYAYASQKVESDGDDHYVSLFLNSQTIDDDDQCRVSHSKSLLETLILFIFFQTLPLSNTFGNNNIVYFFPNVSHSQMPLVTLILLIIFSCFTLSNTFCSFNIVERFSHRQKLLVTSLLLIIFVCFTWSIFFLNQYCWLLLNVWHHQTLVVTSIVS